MTPTRGRPRIADPRRHRIIVLASQREYALLTASARRHRQALSPYLREAALQRAATEAVERRLKR